MIKAIIFDIGGVIYHINGITKEYLLLCEKARINGESPWQDFRDEWNKTKINQMSCSDFYKIIAKKLKVTEKEIKSMFIDNVILDKDIKDLIINLKNNYKIGILSNIIKDLLTKDLELWDFRKIGEIVTSCEDKVKKPDKEAIDLIISKLKVKKEEIIFIDDSKKTIEEYSKQGIKCIKFENKNQLIKELNKFGVKI